MALVAALSTQHSALSTQHSALSTQHAVAHACAILGSARRSDAVAQPLALATRTSQQPLCHSIHGNAHGWTGTRVCFPGPPAPLGAFPSQWYGHCRLVLLLQSVPRERRGPLQLSHATCPRGLSTTRPQPRQTAYSMSLSSPHRLSFAALRAWGSVSHLAWRRSFGCLISIASSRTRT